MTEVIALTLIDEALKRAGIKSGDVICVQSDVSPIMELGGLEWWEDVLELVKNCFLSVIGTSGTLLVPTYNWDFSSKGKTYMHNVTPSQVGLFSNYILFNESSIRSFHPVYSFAAIGPHAPALFEGISKSSYGQNSVFQRLHQMNAKMVFFNLTLKQGATFIHYVEQMQDVDYRFVKEFHGRVQRDGLEFEDTFDLYVRYRDRNIITYLDRLEAYMEAKGKTTKVLIADQYPLVVAYTDDIYKSVLENLKTAPYFLIQYPPSIENKA